MDKAPSTTNKVTVRVEGVYKTNLKRRALALISLDYSVSVLTLSNPVGLGGLGGLGLLFAGRKRTLGPTKEHIGPLKPAESTKGLAEA
jgi:hypothetical protein